MTDKTEIIKELREDEKLGRLYGQAHGSYEKLEVSKETMGSINEPTCITKYEEEEKEGMTSTTHKDSKTGFTELERKFRLITEKTSDLIATATFTLNPTFTYVSPSHKKIVGYDSDDLVGKPFFDFAHPDDKRKLFKLLKKYLKAKAEKILTGKDMDFSERFELRFKDKSGNWRYMETTANLMGNEILSISRDVTENREIMKRFKLAAEVTADIIYEWDVENNTLEWFGNFYEILGYKSCEIPRTIEALTKLIHPNDKRKLKDSFEGHRKSTAPIYGQYRIKRKDDTWLYCENRCGHFLDENGTHIKSIGSLTDINERKNIEMSLKKSEMFLQNIFDAITDGISVLDSNLNIVKTNQWMKDRYSDNTPLIGKKCYQAYQQRDSPCPRCPSILAIESGETQDEIVPYPSNEKPSGWLRLSSFPLCNSNGRVSGVIEYLKDITDYKKAEKSVKENEERLKIILENLQAGVIIIDAATHKIVDINPMAIEMIGTQKENIIGKICHKFMCPIEKGKCPITDLGHKVDNSERVLINANGREITILKTVTPTIINDKQILIESFVEITRQKKIEEELNEKIDELERYKQVTVGREIKMVELKNRIKELEEKFKEEK